MKVTMKDAAFTLRPENSREKSDMAKFFKGMPNNTKLDYGNRRIDPNHPGGDFFTSTLIFEDRVIVLSGTTKDDARLVNHIRSVCAVLPNRAVFLEQGNNSEGLSVTLLCATKCKYCESIAATRTRTKA